MSEVAAQEFRSRWMPLVRQVERSGAPLLITFRGEPFVYAVNTAYYEQHAGDLATLTPAPVMLEAEPTTRRVDWDAAWATAAKADRVVLTSVAASKDFSQVLRLVDLAGTHVIMQLHGRPAVVFVPLAFITTPEQVASDR